MRAAVYAGTRNVYQDMIPSMKSLLIHSNVEKIYFLIEDDEFPYELPPEVECINISHQQWFLPETCPNMKNRCSYMVLLRVVFSKIFPHLDRILTIDNDTIVRENISELWDLDLTDYYLAGCPEYKKTTNNHIYINMGLAMLNLKKFRDDGMDDQLLYDLNTYYFNEAEQSAINQACQGHLLVLDSMYNKNNYTSPIVSKEKIMHYAATKGWQNFPLISKYRDIEIVRNQPDKFDLDIIIPHYNDVQGLRATLNSMNYGLANIIVVDDCSTQREGYEELKQEFPLVTFLQTEENGGQGVARQYGIERSSGMFITFIDAGDCLMSKEVLEHVLKTIKEHTQIYVFAYSWLNEENNCQFDDDIGTFPGKIFRREFLESYDIKFGTTKLTSYSNEDRGFMGICNCVLDYMRSYDSLRRYLPIKKVFYFRTTNENSLTHAENFYNYKLLEGLVYNGEHIVKTCKKANIPFRYVMLPITHLMVQLYGAYMKCARDCPELLEKNLINLKYFYHNVYKQYERVNQKALYFYYNKELRWLGSNTSNIYPRVNINRFIGEIKND